MKSQALSRRVVFARTGVEVQPATTTITTTNHLPRPHRQTSAPRQYYA